MIPVGDIIKLNTTFGIQEVISIPESSLLEYGLMIYPIASDQYFIPWQRVFSYEATRFYDPDQPEEKDQ